MDTKALNLDWEKGDGLLPAIVQDALSGQVLMLAYMNAEALEKTVLTGKVTFWSRSRKALWTKGETSDNFLNLVEVRTDCDSDALLILARPEGPTCHRGTASCFKEDSEEFGFAFLSYLENLVADRRRNLPKGSYTTELFTRGMNQICKKLGEEAVEVVVSANQELERSVEESADLIYHLLVFLAERGVRLEEVVGELKARHS